METFKTIAKKEKSYCLENLKIVDEVFEQEDPKEEVLQPVVADNIKETEFDDLFIMRKFLQSTGEEKNLLPLFKKLEIQYMMVFQQIMKNLLS